ncbi:MAG: phosphatidylserine/phosphatidylglycerophosphate/cardiolipin synthase family protein [Verrucomicrobia bacterium]|nr:phosphatidylserine/phosphatidylglycerophosphate/cardiolipin synthase family protein [Verrucomicrobiota bacterium]
MGSPNETAWKWLPDGNTAFPAMLDAISTAQKSVLLETYIFGTGPLGERFLEALIGAARRGAIVSVLVDGVGSFELPDQFWSPLRAAGGEVRVFNPISLKRMSIRNHRKMLVCDGKVAFVGGFNIANEYEGDGVIQGWRDLGLRLEGPLVATLAESFHSIFGLAEFRHKRFLRLRKPVLKRAAQSSSERLLLGGPGRGGNPIRVSLRHDISQARDVKIIQAYFLPPLRLRRDLMRVARRGGNVELILAGKSDVALSQLAGRGLYLRLLKAGVVVREYEPQVLHAKLLVLDNVVYVGSANLDPRSLSINYELMVRIENPRMAAEARDIYAGTRANSREVTVMECRARPWWTRMKQWFAFQLLARMDPHVARQQWRALPK